MNEPVQLIRELVLGEWSWAGAAAGVALLAGVSLIVAGVPASRRPGLDARLAPYLRDTPPPSRLLGSGSTTPHVLGLGELLAPYLSRLGDGMERVLGGAPSVARRQLRAGSLHPHRLQRHKRKSENLSFHVRPLLLFLVGHPTIIPLL